MLKKRELHHIYNNLEEIHKNHGLVLHGSVFIFALLLGISVGIGAIIIEVAREKERMQVINSYEKQIMSQLVKKIEASTQASSAKIIISPVLKKK